MTYVSIVFMLAATKISWTEFAIMDYKTKNKKCNGEYD